MCLSSEKRGDKRRFVGEEYCFSVRNIENTPAVIRRKFRKDINFSIPIKPLLIGVILGFKK